MDKLMTTDAMQANLGFVKSETAHVETQVYRMRYRDIKYNQLIPVDNSANPWAKTVDYYSMDAAGAARWIADRSSDIPVVGTEMEKHTTSVYMAGIGYDYGLEEINQAAMLRMRLTSEKAMAARRAYEQMIDRIAFTGDTEKGFNGLVSYPTVTAAAVATGSWATATAQEILADVNGVLTAIFTATNEIAIADTLLLPHTALHELSYRTIGDGTVTVLDFLKRANSYTAETGNELTIRSLYGLETAGAGGTRRMIAYRRSPEVLKLHIPMRHRFLPVQVAGLTYKIPGIFRVGGLDIRLPSEVRYGDNF